MNQTLLKSKFRGCILGTLIGDCFGSPFSGDKYSSSLKVVLQKYFDKLDGPYFKAPAKKFTKDSIMTKCTAQALIDNPQKLEPTKLAKLFVKEYLLDPRREYGEGTIKIFHKLRANKFSEPFKPALEEIGTSDNGAAVRVSPIALFHHDNYDEMLKTAKTSVEITHTHKHGITGALLHCLAVQQSLTADPKQFNVENFTSDLIKKLKDVEKDDDGLGINDSTPFTNQMEVVQDLLKNSSVTDEGIVDQLGHSLLAIYSIPTAIYCFLRAQQEIENIKTSNPFRRTLQYAICLGGDTATISSLAGAIAGAYYGEEILGKSMLEHCEDNQTFSQLADDLYNSKFSK